MQFVQKLEQLEKRFNELNAQMADPSVISDAEQYRKVTKAHSELSDVVGKFREWKKTEDSLSQARPMLTEQDPEMRAMAEAEGLAFVDFNGLKRVVEDGLRELQGAPEMEFVEGKDEDEVDAGFREELELVRQRSDEWKMFFRKEDVRGMRMKGDSGGADAELARAFTH